MIGFSRSQSTVILQGDWYDSDAMHIKRSPDCELTATIPASSESNLADMAPSSSKKNVPNAPLIKTKKVTKSPPHLSLGHSLDASKKKKKSSHK